MAGSKFANTSPERQRLAIILASVGGALVFFFSMVCYAYKSKYTNRVLATTPSQLEQQRISGGWGPRTVQESTVERRARLAREAREAREFRTRENQLPMYEPPAPTYQRPTSEVERLSSSSPPQSMTAAPTPMIANGLPPAYNSSEVWPDRAARG